MSQSADAVIKPVLLVWARKSAGMSLEYAAKKLQTSTENLKAWEKGEKLTTKQLRKAAQVYKQSFAAFYLDEAPEFFVPPIRDYRHLPEATRGKLSPELFQDIRLALDHREQFLELQEEQNTFVTEFSKQTSLNEDPEKLSQEIRKWLNISLERQSEWKDTRIGFNSWRGAIESKGILVLQTKRVPISEMRGYSLAQLPLPIIVLNRKDAYAGRSFSLIHETVHLMLRASGLCDLEARENGSLKEIRTEAFCNEVAGVALVPRVAFLASAIVRRHVGEVWENNEMEKLARQFSVSREVILGRALSFGLTSKAFYERKLTEFRMEYEKRPKQDGFVPPHVDAVSLNGKPFVRLVLNSFLSDRITASDLSSYLGVKLQHLEKIKRAVES